jgi:hypothetical protein
MEIEIFDNNTYSLEIGEKSAFNQPNKDLNSEMLATKKKSKVNLDKLQFENRTSPSTYEDGKNIFESDIMKQIVDHYK